MSSRKPLSKTLRFEVFERDRFTCQYCGAKAPEVVLHVDHIHPVARGGADDLMNLITACVACNGGKGARLLDDHAAVERQRTQIEELEARREQLEMMLAWRDSAVDGENEIVEAICNRIAEHTQNRWVPNENGKASVRKWLDKYSLAEVLAALDIAFRQYLVFGKRWPTDASCDLAFSKVGGIASVRRSEADKPYIRKLLYIQGILRNRWRMPHERYMDMLESMHVEWGASLEFMVEQAKRVDSTQEFWTAVEVHSAEIN